MDSGGQMKSIHQMTLAPDFNQEDLKSFVRKELRPLEIANPGSTEFSMDATKKMYDRGLLNLIAPKAIGGTETTVSDFVWIMRELGYSAPSCAITLIGNLLGHSPVFLYGSEEMKKRLCLEHSKSFSLWSCAMTEEAMGSDLVRIQTEARQVPGGFVINGEKNFITNATYSSHMSVFARLIDESGCDKGISCFYIPGSTAGVSRGKIMQKTSFQKANTGTIHFKNVFVPSEHLIGEPGCGLKILSHCLNRSKALLAALGIGISYRALDLATERIQSTNRGGKLLIEQSGVRHVMARLHTQTEAAWLLTCRAAATWDAGLPATKESSMAKLFAASTAVEVTSKAIEFFGARGLFVEYEVSRLLAHAKALEIIEGPILVQELIIAREVLPKRLSVVPATSIPSDSSTEKKDAA